MGMEPKTPDAGILEMLEIAEAEIRLREQNKDNRPTFTTLKTIQRLKRALEFSDANLDKLSVEMLGVGFLLGVTAPGSRDERLKAAEKLGLRFIQKDRTKAKLTLGEKGPGRNNSEITYVMNILLSKIPPPSSYTYTRKKFIDDLIANHRYLKQIIKPVKINDGYICFCKNGVSAVSIEWSLKKLKYLAKKNPQNNKFPLPITTLPTFL